MNSRIWTGILCVLLTALPVLSTQASEQAEVTLPATMREALELALENRTELRIENANVAMQQMGVKEARSAYFPKLDFLSEGQHIIQYDKYTGYNVTVDVAGTTFRLLVEQEPLPYTMTSSLELNYNLYAGGRDTAFMKKAQATKAGAEHQRDAVRRNIVLEVTIAYWEARKAQIVCRIAKRWCDHYRASMQAAEAQFKASRLAEVDRAIAQLRFKEQDLAVKQANRDLVERAQKYRCALGMESIDDDGTRKTSVMPDLIDDPEQDFLIQETDIMQHPELLKLHDDMVASRADIKVTRSEFLPKLDFFARYAFVGRDADDFLSAFDDYHSNYNVYGLRLTMKLFDGFKTRYRSSKAELAADIARQRYEQAKQDLADAVHELSTRVEKAQDDITLAKQRLMVSEAKERVAKSQRQIGKYSDLEYQKVRLAMKEEADKVLMAEIDLAIAKLRRLLVSLN